MNKTIQLIGDKSQFIMADGWLPNRDGNFYKPGNEYITDSGLSIDDGAAGYSRELD